METSSNCAIGRSGGEEATTAYGAMKAVPIDNVDLLVAGTSCVDYSNLNNKQQTIEQKGESGQTFWGMMAWIRRARPPIVLQENVCGAPWPTMVKEYEKEGYAATFQRVDTKNHYIPHTRTRVYLLAIDTRAVSCKTGESNRKVGQESARWEAAINELSRPSSSSLEAFLLPTDDPRVHRARLDLASGKRGSKKETETNWDKCESRHQRCRVDEELGQKRTVTNWQPAARPRSRTRCGTTF